MRMIDALQESQWDYFINCIYDCCNELGAPDNISANCLIDQLSYMEINAVPVVRCRECKQGEVDDPDFPDQYYCHAGCGWNNGDFYCAYGERKEGADNEP